VRIAWFLAVSRPKEVVVPPPQPPQPPRDTHAKTEPTSSPTSGEKKRKKKGKWPSNMTAATRAFNSSRLPSPWPHFLESQLDMRIRQVHALAHTHAPVPPRWLASITLISTPSSGERGRRRWREWGRSSSSLWWRLFFLWKELGKDDVDVLFSPLLRSLPLLPEGADGGIHSRRQREGVQLSSAVPHLGRRNLAESGDAHQGQAVCYPSWPCLLRPEDGMSE